MHKPKTLGEYIIENQNDFQYSSGELSRLLSSIKLASKVVNHEVNKAGLVILLGPLVKPIFKVKISKNWMFMPTIFL